MKKTFILLATFALTLSLGSCRDTEMNTDGNMEEQETRKGAMEVDS